MGSTAGEGGFAAAATGFGVWGLTSLSALHPTVNLRDLSTAVFKVSCCLPASCCRVHTSLVDSWEALASSILLPGRVCSCGGCPEVVIWFSKQQYYPIDSCSPVNTFVPGLKASVHSCHCNPRFDP